MIFSTLLLDTLRKLEKTFRSDELAYLAVTSKVEGPIRDRIAYDLHAQVKTGLFVNREWKDPRNSGWIDIAITDEQNRAKFLLELKAHSAPTFEPGYSELMRRDLRKLCQAAEDDTELYVIFLFNHLYNATAIDPKYFYSIKYFSLQNNASIQNQFATDVSPQTRAHWERHLVCNGISLDKSQPGVRIAGGHYHGMPVAVHAYVLGPTYRSELEGL